MQGSTAPVRGPSTAEAGGGIKVTTGKDTKSLIVFVCRSRSKPVKTTVPTGAGGSTEIPVPGDLQPGESIVILDDKVPPGWLRVEIVAPAP